MSFIYLTDFIRKEIDVGNGMCIPMLNVVHRILNGRTTSYLTNCFTKLEDVNTYKTRAGATNQKFAKCKTITGKGFLYISNNYRVE